MFKYTKNKNYYQKGQILLVILIVLMVLLIILFAIVFNLRTDIKEQQIEREYESGYAIAEEELYKVKANGFAEDYYSDKEIERGDSLWNKYCSAAELDCPNSSVNFRCYNVNKVSAEGENISVILKRCVLNEISEMDIPKDDVLEVNLVGASGLINLNWENAPAVSIMLVCKNVSNLYVVNRMAICRPESDCNSAGISGFSSYSEAQSIGKPLNLASGACVSGYEPILLRIRAIGDDAKNVRVYASSGSLPPQMEKIRAQGFSRGVSNAFGIPSPEVYSISMINKKVPAIFDYVLFVAEDDLKKE